MDKAIKRERYHRLKKNGLWRLAEAMIDTRNKQIRATKKSTSLHDKESVAQAWNEVWMQLEPLCAHLEKIKQDKERFVGHTGNPDELVDPDYKETDKVKQVADAYIWLGDQFRRVVTDTKDGTSIDFSKATKKPPTVFAVQLLEEYARTEPGSTQRRAMTDKVHQVIGKLASKPKPQSKTSRRSGIGYAGDL